MIAWAEAFRVAYPLMDLSIFDLVGVEGIRRPHFERICSTPAAFDAPVGAPRSILERSGGPRRDIFSPTTCDFDFAYIF